MMSGIKFGVKPAGRVMDCGTSTIPFSHLAAALQALTLPRVRLKLSCRRVIPALCEHLGKQIRPRICAWAGNRLDQVGHGSRSPLLRPPRAIAAPTTHRALRLLCVAMPPLAELAGNTALVRVGFFPIWCSR